MKKSEVIIKLQSGNFCIYRDCDNKDLLLSDILFESFPLKERRTEFAPDAFFFGKKDAIWLGRVNNDNGLKRIRLSEVEAESEYKYSVTAKIVDNTTGKHADVFMSGNDPAKLANGLAKFVEASCSLVNMDEEDLREIQIMVKQLVEEKTNG